MSDEWLPMHQLARLLNPDGHYNIDSVDQINIPEDIHQYQYVLMYVHKTLERNVEAQLIQYANNGGKLIVLHHGLASAKMKNPDWLNIMGIELFPSDDPQYPWCVLSNTTHTMVNLYPGHFITSNRISYQKVFHFESDYTDVLHGTYPEFDLSDTEVFLNQRFTENSDRTILFGFVAGDGTTMQPTSGWYKKVGGGWLFYYQAGHRPEDFSNNNFLQVILNTLEWKPELNAIEWDVEDPIAPSCYEKNKNGWEDQVTGKGLDNWKEYTWPPGSPIKEEFMELPAQWHWNQDNGILFCDASRGHSYLATKAEFIDFILHVEWRYMGDEGSQNSGILVRMLPERYVMHQCELSRSNLRLFGGVLMDSIITPITAIEPGPAGLWQAGIVHFPYDWNKRIKLQLETPNPKVPSVVKKSHERMIRQIGEWNTTEILCVKNYIIIWNNGSICSYTDNCTIMEGVIGLEAEGHPLEFRNVLIRPVY